jgi:hypothetical protein
VSLRAEAQTVDRYCNDLEQFDKDLVVLRRKQSITHEEFDKQRNKADVLKRRWSEVQLAVRSTINKLKAADLWSEFDNLILVRISDSKVRAFITSQGGLKRAMEDALSLNPDEDPLFDLEKSLRPRLSTRVQDLRFKPGQRDLGFSALEVAYNPAAPKFGERLLCAGATIRKGISSAINDYASDKATCLYTCRCISPDMGCSHCDGL